MAVILPLFSLDFRCTLGSGETCYRRGKAYEDLKRLGLAYRLFRAACRRDHAQGCTAAGNAARQGLGRSVDRAAARVFLEKGCALGSGEGCASLGFILLRGEGVPAQPKEALAFLAAGCAKGSSLGCALALAEHRNGRVVPSDPASFLRLGERACRDHFFSCCEAGAASARGYGRPADSASAAALFHQGCESGDLGACAEVWSTSETVSPAIRDTAERMAQACGANASERCDSPCDAGSPETRRRLEQSARQLRKRCDEGEPLACYAVGLMQQRGWGVPYDPAAASAQLERACEAGLGMACYAAARTDLPELGFEESAMRSWAFYEKGCARGSRAACVAMTLD